MKRTKLNRRDFLRLSAVLATGAVAAACAPAAPQVVEVEKQVPVEKVVKETVIVEKEVVVEKEVPAKPAEKITISWMMRSQPRENEWEEERVATYEERNPNVKVNLIIAPGGELNAKWAAMWAAGTPPSVASQWGVSFSTTWARGQLLELTPYIESDDYDLTQFIPMSYEVYVRNGKYYSVPQVTNFGFCMFYNKEHFDEAGLDYLPTDWNDTSWNWDTMIEYAKKLTKDWGAGIEAQYGVLFGMDVRDMAMLWDGDWLIPDHYKTYYAKTCQLDTQECIEAAQGRADLTYEHKVAPTPADSASLQQQLGDVFMTAKISMSPGGSWRMRVLQEAEFSFGVGALPGKFDNRHRIFNGCWFIPVLEPHPDATWEFVKYLTTTETMRGLTEVGFGVPRVDLLRESWYPLYSDKTGMSIDQLSQVFEHSLDNCVEDHHHILPGISDALRVMTQESDPIWMGTERAEDVLPTMKKKVDDVLQRTWDEFH